MNDKKFIIIVFFLALLIRLAYVYFFIGFNAEEVRDGTFFENIAINISEGKGIALQDGLPTAKKPPVYLIFLGGIYKVFGPDRAAARVAQCIIGALLPVFIFYIAKELYPSPIDKIAAFTTVFYPALIFFCGRILAEPLLALSIAAFVLITLKIKNESQHVYQLLSGVFLGISILTRSLLIFMPFLLFFWTFFTWSNEKKAKLLKINFIILIGVLIIFIPWIYRNYRVFNKFVPIASESGLSLWLSNQPGGRGYIKVRGLSPRYKSMVDSGKENASDPYDQSANTRNIILDQPWGGLNEVDVDNKFFEMLLTWIKKHPLEFIKLLPRKILTLWDGLYLFSGFSPIVVPNKLWISIPFIFIMPLALYEIFSIRKEWKKFLLIYLIFLSEHMLVLFTHADYRIRTMLMPYYFIFMSAGLIRIIYRYKGIEHENN